MRVLFAGGGTSGHLVPCLAVAQTLRRRHPDAEVEFVVSRRATDRDMLAARDFIARPISGSGMPYGLSATAFASLYRLGVGGCQALGIVKRFRPDVVFATGGFISAAVVTAAKVLRVPIMLHASDAMPDRTNRLLARWADLVSTVSQSAADQFKARRCVVTGQPVRPEVLEADPSAARTELGVPETAFVVLVTGGSQGAQRLNDATIAALPELLANPDVHVIHLTGVGKLPNSGHRAALNLHRDRYLIEEGRNDMASVLAAADLVVTRAGASSLAEASAWGRPMIVVPYPHAGGHQQHNAAIYEQAGAAIVVADAAFTAPRLTNLVARLQADCERRRAMSQAAVSIGTREAAAAVFGHLLTLLPSSPQAFH